MQRPITDRPPDPPPAPRGGLPLIEAPRELRGFPLGTVILRLGLLPEGPINDALGECDRSQRQLGRYLVELGLLDEAGLARSLATQKGLPFLDCEGLIPDPEAVALLTAHTTRTMSALPVGFDGRVPVVAISDPTDDRVFEQVRTAIGADVIFAVAAPGLLKDAIGAGHVTAPVENVVPHLAAAVDPPGESHPTSGVSVYREVMTLSTGERLDVATALDSEVAAKRRGSMVDELKRGSWPLVGERAIRPEAVVSIDLIETQLDA